jgi:hypothetical protein
MSTDPLRSAHAWSTWLSTVICLLTSQFFVAGTWLTTEAFLWMFAWAHACSTCTMLTGIHSCFHQPLKYSFCFELWPNLLKSHVGWSRCGCRRSYITPSGVRWYRDLKVSLNPSLLSFVHGADTLYGVLNFLSPQYGTPVKWLLLRRSWCRIIIELQGGCVFTARCWGQATVEEMWCLPLFYVPFSKTALLYRIAKLFWINSYAPLCWCSNSALIFCKYYGTYLQN